MIDVAVVDPQVLPRHASDGIATAWRAPRRGARRTSRRASAAHARHAAAMLVEVRTASPGRAPPPDRPSAVLVIRSAHSPPHHARSSSVAKHQAVADAVDRGEPGLEAPVPQVAAGVGLAAVGLRHRAVQRRATGRARATPGTRSSPGRCESRAATTPSGRQTRRISRSAATGSAEVLQHLVRVHDVERRRRRGRARTRRRWPARGCRRRRRRRRPGPRRSRRRPRRCRAPDPGATRWARSIVIVPGPHPTSSRSTPGPEVGEEVGGGVLDRAPAVRAQHALGVAVRVGLGSLAHGRTVPAMILPHTIDIEGEPWTCAGWSPGTTPTARRCS